MAPGPRQEGATSQGKAIANLRLPPDIGSSGFRSDSTFANLQSWSPVTPTCRTDQCLTPFRRQRSKSLGVRYFLELITAVDRGGLPGIGLLSEFSTGDFPLTPFPITTRSFFWRRLPQSERRDPGLRNARLMRESRTNLKALQKMGILW